MGKEYVFYVLVQFYFISSLSIWLFSSSLGHNPLLRSPQLCYFLLATSGKTFDVAYSEKKGTVHPALSALRAFLYPSSWGRRISSVICLSTTFTALFILFQGTCCELETPRNKDGIISCAFPWVPDCSTWGCSLHFGSATPTTILQLKLSSEAEIPLLLSLYFCGFAKHILRHIFVLCLKNIALTRGEWSL